MGSFYNLGRWTVVASRWMLMYYTRFPIRKLSFWEEWCLQLDIVDTLPDIVHDTYRNFSAFTTCAACSETEYSSNLQKSLAAISLEWWTFQKTDELFFQLLTTYLLSAMSEHPLPLKVKSAFILFYSRNGFLRNILSVFKFKEKDRIKKALLWITLTLSFGAIHN